jgi:hypothetical protein
MRFTVVSTADYASISLGDKLNVLGVFDTIISGTFPCHHAHMVFAVRLQFEYGDSGRRLPFQLRLEDADGHRSFETQAEIGVATIAPGEFTSNNLIVDLNNLEFRAPGTYLFVVRCGDQETAVPFRVDKAPTA